MMVGESGVKRGGTNGEALEGNHKCGWWEGLYAAMIGQGRGRPARVIAG